MMERASIRACKLHYTIHVDYCIELVRLTRLLLCYAYLLIHIIVMDMCAVHTYKATSSRLQFICAGTLEE